MAAANVNNEAKESFITKIINLFPDNYVGCYDKKYYFWENGVQIAVTLTCPKTPIGETNTPPSAFAETPAPEQVEFTQTERETLSKLMEALGI